ncbi:hypothetical protein [Lysobacter sp. Root494]|uniref:hypothetical protein n=1 Tax=Lysobacter sp. Root494 TaxID=1736549 RepID=UPI0006F96742|nr:hypothetical protein [Lysobacter sp. Root494]KQY51924.1 hypothetical protein ASD14_04425 [Lysobacter sp. Root494]
MVETSLLAEELHRLVDDLLPFAEKMLRQHREFLPFGGHVKADGEIVWEGAYNGEELPLSQDLIDLLHESHRKMASRHLIRACAVIYDIRAIPPGKLKEQDAICVAADSRDGHSVRFVFPYRFGLFSKLVVEDGYTIPEGAGIFSPSA